MRQLVKYLLLSLPAIVITTTFGADLRVDQEKYAYYLNPDKSYVELGVQEETVLTTNGIKLAQEWHISHFPETQSVKILSAYVTQPDGKKTDVSEDNIFTRPSPATRVAPGFTNSQTTTIVFPQLKVGSKIHLKYRFKQLTPHPFGFNALASVPFNTELLNQQVTIHAPKELSLRVAKRGLYNITDKMVADERIITAKIVNQQVSHAEEKMVNSSDVMPYFVATTLNSWEQLGHVFWENTKSRIQVTPEIEKLAKRITEGQKGEAAARAINNWVAKNIHYVALNLNDASGYQPHSATEILANGFGDSKDNVVILSSLLKAIGIQSQPVLVSWSDSFSQYELPVPAQFNHAMIYLPSFKKFANPTSDFASFGVLDKELSNKFVIIAADKSFATYTPKANPFDNKYTITNNLIVMPNGDIQGTGIIRIFGRENEAFRREMSQNAQSRVANHYLMLTPEGGYGKIDASSSDDLDHNMIIKTSWNSPLAIEMEKESYFSIPLGIEFRNPHFLRSYITPGKRQFPIVIGSRNIHWQYTIALPDNASIKHLPKNVTYKNPTGEYHATYMQQGDNIIVSRDLIIKRDTYSADEYDAFRKLLYQPINDSRAIISMIPGKTTS